ncbi:restriction endonuclease subunit S [Kaistella palustris]|uniref:restriction endonuclease subunit S n=1 Tax=Kaistella palustris TaxID=493376 RepID=UPI00041D05D5|nr:restriction endonuclease subunit S [Kaistella palustris]
MKSGYKRLGNYIRLLDERNRDLEVKTLLGVSIRKMLIPSIANVVGTDMSTYKIIKKNQFAYGTVTSRNGDKISIALLKEFDKAIVSQVYLVFEVIDKELLLPDYLMMWFRRPEFDRYARFKSHGSARETFDWAEMLETELPIPSLEKQKEVIAEYEVIENRVQLNKKLCATLEETAQTIYKHWFEDFEFPVQSKSDPELVEGYKSSGGEMVECEELGKEIPVGWRVDNLGTICENFDSKRIPLSSFERKDLNKIYPYYGASSILDYVDRYLFDGTYILLGEDGTVITENGTPILQYVVGKFWVNNHAHVLKATNNFTEESLYLFLKNKNITNKITGAVQLKINQANLLSIRMIIPNNNIISNFNIIAEIIFKKNQNLKDQIEKLEELESLLLGKMAVED